MFEPIVERLSSYQKVISSNTKEIVSSSSNFIKKAAAVAVSGAFGITAHAQDNDIKVSWKDSLRLESVDGNNKFRLGGRIHWENAFFGDDEFGGKSVEDGDV